ncbi:MAG: hypothetical protein A2045_02420 [Rhodocyclales bacterium GWA2_65_20]|nr:MAG: hypothetical protein A2045_02420 [Rhodocyclales bacterium GWA2_65_20]
MKRTTWIAVVLALIAGGMAGAWWAYQEGRLGKNPRAPTLENFKPVIDAWAFRKGELRPKCISASPDSAPGSRRGRPGWSTTDTMGLGVATLALKTPAASQQLMRDKTLLRFDTLAKEGFFKAADAELRIETGETLPAREYVLTQKGWENSYSGCFHAGRPEVLEVVSFARVQPDPEEVRAYEITYKVGVRALPPWAISEEARDIFGDLKPHKAVEEKRLRLLRAEKGWLPEPLVKTKEGTLEHSRLRQTIDDLLPPITPAQIMELGKEHEFLRDPRACLLVPRSAGHDADEIEWSLNGPVSMTMYEPDAISNPVPRIRESWAARMINLVQAGVFHEEGIPRDDLRNRPPGTKYILDEKYLPYISKGGPGCLHLGTMKVEILPNTIELQGRQDGTLNYNFKAIGRIGDDSWARGISWSGIPEVEAYLAYGVPIGGSVEFSEGKWRIGHAGAATPVIVEPPRIQPTVTTPVSQTPGSSVDTGHRGGGTAMLPTQPGSVHVIAVYQAMGAGGNHAEGTIRVGVGARGRPITLVLSAYEPVHWQIQPDPGAEIAKVVVMGNYPGRISGVPQDRVQRANGYLQDYKTDGSGRRRHNPQSTVETVERLVGRRPDSVDGAYESRYFSLGSSRTPPQPPAVQPRPIGNAVAIPMPVLITPRPLREPGR